MSGRKSWEVASVLNEVEKVFDEIVNGYKSEIEQNLSVVDEIKAKSKGAKSKIDSLDDENLKKELSGFDSWFKISENIENEVEEIFESIKNSKAKAKALRKRIKNSSHYMDEEYAEAQGIKQTLNESKQRLSNLKNSSLKLKNSSKKLNNVLENINDLYSAKKSFLNELYESVKERFEKKEFVKLEDFVERNGVKVSRCDYFDHYKDEDVTSQVKERLDNAKNLLDSEKFKECENELRKIDERLNEIFLEADRLKENIESSFALTVKIRDLMSDEINFREVEVDLIDGNPANGFKLICKNGDTLIFDEIKVDDGEVKVELDHIEKVSGSCGVRWKEMKEVLNQNGIPLMDVTKDGRSIFDGSRFKDRRIDRKERER